MQYFSVIANRISVVTHSKNKHVSPRSFLHMLEEYNLYKEQVKVLRETLMRVQETPCVNWCLIVFYNAVHPHLNKHNCLILVPL